MSLKKLAAIVVLLSSGLWRAGAAEEATNPPAQAKEEEKDLPVLFELSVLSSYNWRGQLPDDRPVVLPQVTVAKYGISLLIWANFSLDNENTGDRDFSEVDYYLWYDLPLPEDTLEVSVGVVDYGPKNLEPFHEAFISVACPNDWITPCVEAYQSFNPDAGYYVSAALIKEVSINDKWLATGEFSTGFGSGDYNVYSFEVDGSRLNDGSVYLSLSYDVTDTLVLTPSLKYTWLWDSKIDSAAKTIYADSKSVTGGLTLSYSF